MEPFEIVGIISDLGTAALIAALFVFVLRSRDTNEERQDGLLEQALKLFAGLNDVIMAATEAIKALTQEVKDDQMLTARVHRDMQTEHSAQRATLDSISAMTANVSATIESAKADMLEISARRDAQHMQVMALLQPISDRLDEILKHITLATDENTLRHEVSKAVLLLSEVKATLSIPQKPATDDLTRAAERAVQRVIGKRIDGAGESNNLEHKSNNEKPPTRTA